MNLTPPLILSSAALLWLPCAANAEATAVLRYPAPASVTLNTVSWSGSRFIAAGENGVILTSATGETWEAQTAPIVRRWLCGASGGGRTMLGGDRGGMVESIDDGITWTAVMPPIPSEGSPFYWRFTAFDAAAFDAGRFFLSSSSVGGALVSSTPGHFTPVEALHGFSGFTRGASELVASSAVAAALLHFTGTGWTVADMAPSSPRIARLAWTGARYAGLPGSAFPQNAGEISTSADGVTWTPRTSGVSSRLRAILWTGSQAVVIGDDGVILTSPDGAVWTRRESGTVRDLTAAAWSGTTLVAVGEAGVVLTSPDGVVWTKRNEPERPLSVGALTWLSTGGYAFPNPGRAGGGLYPNPGDPPGSLRSADGLAWTRSTALESPAGPVASAATNGTSVVVASASGMWVGPASGSSWSRFEGHATAVGWNGQSFLARYYASSRFSPCATEEEATSPDALTWSGLEENSCGPFSSSEESPLDALVWTGQRYVRRGFFSDSTGAWQPVTGTQGLATWLVWTGTEALAAGLDGRVSGSPTGEHWTQKTTPPPEDLRFLSGVTWAGTRLIASENLIAMSPENVREWTPGGGWRKVSSLPAQSVAWTGSHILVAAYNGIYTLENLPAIPVTWTGWLALHFPGTNDPAITGPEADPDGDGCHNLVEYAAGSLPALSSSRPAAGMVPGSSGPAFEWNTETAHTGVTLKPQVSSDLASWDDITGTVVRTEGTVVTRQVSIPSSGRFFFRLAGALQN